MQTRAFCLDARRVNGGLNRLNQTRLTQSQMSGILNNLVSPAGVEPATYALGGRRAIQLCHGDSWQSIS